jgi:uncharacterized repeat protein (TIGR02543 family)
MNALQARVAVVAALTTVTLSLPAATPAAVPAQGTVSVTLVGSGSVQSSPAGINCGGNCKATFPLGSAVRLSGAPGSGFYLAGWTGDCVGGAQTCEATADENTQVQAQFVAGSAPTPPVHALTVSFSGEGRVTSSQQGVIDCGSNCWTSFSGGGHLTLNAAPASGFVFDGWAGDCSGAGSCDVAVTGLRSVVAVFKRSSIPAGTSTLTIVNNEAGSSQGKGRIRISWPNHSEDCDSDECDINGVPNGVRVRIQPLPGPNTVVENYGGACLGSAQQCTVILNEDAGVTTSFQNSSALTTSYGLNLTRSTGGSVQSVPPGIDCGGDAGCKAAFKRNIPVRLTVNVANGYTFGGWSGDCNGTTGCSVSMTVSRTVSAAFRAIRDQLSVVKSGRGIGTITTDPAGIQCGEICAYSFRRASSVTVRAVPNGSSRFRTWSGPCSGRKQCSLTITAPAQLTAAFDRCAASVFSSFKASTTLSAATVRLLLADRATVRLRLLRGRTTLASRTFGNLSAGAKSLRLPIRRAVGAGKAKVEVKLNDICGRTRALTRVIALR